ncbi:MAG: hypothetical protein Q7S40_33175 [Opitutaceae bacterium]|nr:hypothetical protein [Opitutaceae bacterium]
MAINVPVFLLGLLLLWIPRPWMRFGAILGRRRRRNSGGAWKQEPWNRQESGDLRLSFRAEFTKARNYLDLLRAATGALVIIGGYQVQPALAAAAGATRFVTQEVLVVKIAVLLVGVLLQTLRYEHRRVTFFAPVFFLAGLSVILCGYWSALFAFIFVWGVNSVFNNAQAFLTVYALLLAAFGLLFKAANYRFAPAVNFRFVIAAALFCFLPVLLSLMTGRRLGVFTRKGAHMRKM